MVCWSPIYSLLLKESFSVIYPGPYEDGSCLICFLCLKCRPPLFPVIVSCPPASSGTRHRCDQEVTIQSMPFWWPVARSGPIENGTLRHLPPCGLFKFLSSIFKFIPIVVSLDDHIGMPLLQKEPASSLSFCLWMAASARYLPLM